MASTIATACISLLLFTFLLVSASSPSPQTHRRLLQDKHLVSQHQQPLLLNTKKNKTTLLNPTHHPNKSSDLLRPNPISKKKKNKNKNKGGDDEDEAKNKKNIQNEIPKKQQNIKTPTQPDWIHNLADDNDDLVSEFAHLPAKFHQTIVPDLKRISSSSKTYFSKATKEITKGFKPYVGNEYAQTVATATSLAFIIIIPFLVVSVLFNRIRAYFSLQRLLIFIQVYLSIYFSILCLSSLITGLEPLRFFYATSQSTYVWLQLLQTLGYVFYLLLLFMYLVLVFSTHTGPRLKLLGFAQIVLGFAVGLHYYMTVFHRMVLHQPPKTTWRVHAIYATCFLVICLIVGADDRKKAYLGEGGEEGKKS